MLCRFGLEAYGLGLGLALCDLVNTTASRINLTRGADLSPQAAALTMALATKNSTFRASGSQFIRPENVDVILEILDVGKHCNLKRKERFGLMVVKDEWVIKHGTGKGKT